MRSCALLLVMVVSAFAAGQNSREAAQVEAAKQSAEAWLSGVDSGNYLGSWDQADAAFKGGINKMQWERIWKLERAPVGTFQSRNFKKAEFKTHIPEDPKEDKWVVIQYESTFAQRTATEIIAIKQDQDGQWRVAGYNVIPGQAVAVAAPSAESASAEKPAPPPQ